MLAQASHSRYMVVVATLIIACHGVLAVSLPAAFITSPKTQSLPVSSPLAPSHLAQSSAICHPRRSHVDASLCRAQFAILELGPLALPPLAQYPPLCRPRRSHDILAVSSLAAFPQLATVGGANPAIANMLFCRHACHLYGTNNSAVVGAKTSPQ